MKKILAQFLLFLSCASYANDNATIKKAAVTKCALSTCGGNACRGPRGHKGHRGPRGKHGKRGRRGITGPGGILAYAYLYNVDGSPQTPGNAINFLGYNGDGSGSIFSAGINFTGIGFSNVQVANAGVYLIQFSVTMSGPNQYALAINGVPQQTTIYATGIPPAAPSEFTFAEQNNGFAILPLNAGDVITLINHTTTFQNPVFEENNGVGGTEISISGAMMILRLA